MSQTKNESGTDYGNRVLVIEDNPDNYRLIEYALKRAGYEISWAETGEDGVAKAAESLPDLIIMDINLPGIDGLETTRRIRQNKNTAETPIVAITSYAMRGDRDKAIEAGCNGYLEKPINPLTVVESIEGFIKDK